MNVVMIRRSAARYTSLALLCAGCFVEEAFGGKTILYDIVHLARHREIHIVPAPGPEAPRAVEIDGKLDDWDLSGALRVRMDDLEPARLGVTAAMMYDGGALYVGAHVRDPTPMANRVPAGGLIWRGDHLAVRMVPAPAPGKFDRFAPGDLERRIYLNFWYATASRRAEFEICRVGERASEMNPDGVTGAYVKDEDGGGYTLEYRVPWSVIRPAKAFGDGDRLRVMWQMHWGDVSGEELTLGATFPRHPDWRGNSVTLYDVPASWGTGVFGKPAANAAPPEAADGRAYSKEVRRVLAPPELRRPEPADDGGKTVWRLTPEMDLQSAADRAGPGHVLELAPGVYRQSLVLKKGGGDGAPLTIRAAAGGTATLTGGAPGLKLKFERLDGNTWRAAVPWPVSWARADGRNLINYLNMDNFKSQKFGDGAPAPPEGFCRDEQGFLHLRLKDDGNPSDTELDIQGPTRSCINILLSGASHVVIEGLRFDMAPYVGVFLKDGRDITIRDCFFAGCNRGIRAERAERVVVENCEFSGYPICQWIRGGPYWGPLYESMQSVSFISGGGPAWRIRNNFVYECFDAFQAAPAPDQEYAGNLIVNAADDCFELDHDVPPDVPSSTRIHHNVIIDAWDTFSLAPHSGGRLLVDHNLVYDSPEYGRAPWKLTFKLAQHADHLGDVAVVHNTLLNRRFGILGPVSRISRIENFVFVNNIIEEVGWSPWTSLIENGMTVDEHNLYCPIRRPDGVVEPGDPPSLDGGEHPHSDAQIRQRLPGLKRYGDGAGFVADPRRLRWWDGGNAPGFADYRPGRNAPRVEEGQLDAHLAPDSPAVDGGVPTELCPHEARGDAPDLGAIELGTQWDFPRPGPSWADFTNCPWRPPLPPSFDPRLAGFGKSRPWR